ncbi:sugar phosphate isomerase/epimerase family protein [Quadrisphaera sp. KR29]|uniref:sugar phosphate isomerase/epimerase family protein n=1 Tax=Quadrisphaera sp. KR29 TaxID=3461391 RepID=UPI004045028B
MIQTQPSAPVRVPPLHLSALTLKTTGFAQRVRAAASAGYAGIGLGAADYLSARRSGIAEDDIRGYLSRAGLEVVELEFLRDWWTEADVRGTRLEEDILLHLADLTGAQQINVGLFDVVPDDVVRRGFERLCTRAARHGLRIGVEFMPYAELRTLAAARALVEDVGAPNSGLILDAWHWHRSGGSLEEVAAAADDGLVVSVQLCDALPEPMADLREEGRHHRQLPGEGVVDLLAWLEALAPALDGSASRPPATVATEVLSDAVVADGAGEACRRTADAGRRVLEAFADRRDLADR